MLVAALPCQRPERIPQIIQIRAILATRSSALQNPAGQGVRVLWAEKLRVRREADVDEAADGRRGGRERDGGLAADARGSGGGGGRGGGGDGGRGRWQGVEGRELDAVTVYLAYVEVLAHGSDVGGGNVVGGAPDAVGGGFVLQRAVLVPSAICAIPVVWYSEAVGRRTVSASVFQCCFEISVTTRPGASGVPRWSSLCGSWLILIPGHNSATRARQPKEGP